MFSLLRFFLQDKVATLFDLSALLVPNVCQSLPRVATFLLGRFCFSSDSLEMIHLSKLPKSYYNNLVGGFNPLEKI